MSTVNPPTAHIDPRIHRTRTVVLTSTLHVIADRGFEGASIEAISAHSGVARSTIYRHWPKRSDLLLDAIESLLVTEPNFTFTELRTDLIGIANALSYMLMSEPVGTVIAALMVEARRDAHVARLHQQFVTKRMGIATTAVETAIAEGHLPRTTDATSIATQIVAPLFFRTLLQRETPEPAWIEDLVDRWLRSQHAT